jgi:hypothetical protein
MEEIQFLALPTLLDPRFKKIAFTQRTAADRAVRTLLHEVTVQNQQSSPPTTNSTEYTT